MTDDEFHKQMMDIIHKYNNSNEMKFDVFVSVMDTTTKMGVTFGYGCQACHAKTIVYLFEDGQFQHSNQRTQIH